MELPISVPDPQPLAPASLFVRRFEALARNLDPLTIDELMVEATDHLEDMTSRKLAPFEGWLYEDMLNGIDPNEYGDTSAGMPIDFYGSLGTSYANALGAGDLVRHFWLDQSALSHPELWTYEIQSMDLVLTYGNYQPIDFRGGGIIGPEITSGHCWLRLGTFAPEGTRIRVQYSGGYTKGIPPSLRRACLFQAAKFAILESEQQLRSGNSLDYFEMQINQLIAPWVKL